MLTISKKAMLLRELELPTLTWALHLAVAPTFRKVTITQLQDNMMTAGLSVMIPKRLPLGRSASRKFVKAAWVPVLIHLSAPTESPG